MEEFVGGVAGKLGEKVVEGVINYFSGATDIFSAIRKTDFAAVKIFVEEGADINKREDKGDLDTPLIIAVSECSEYDEKPMEIVKFLLSKGADINKDNKKGWRPLDIAVINEQTKTIELLLLHGADINARDNMGRTPLHFVCDHKTTEIAEMLISNGADINAKDEQGMTPLRSAETEAIKLFLRKHEGKE